MLHLIKFPASIFFLCKTDLKQNENLELCFKHGLTIIHRDNALNEGACFAGIGSLPAPICFNQPEKSDCVQLKRCLSALLLFLFFSPVDPQCWRTSFSLHKLHSQTVQGDVSFWSCVSSAQPHKHADDDRHLGVVIHDKWQQQTVSPRSGTA